MAKHIIYLEEAAEATFAMSQRILTHHGEVLLSHPPQPGDDTRRTMQRVHQMLAQKVTQFECWKIRMESMQKRMENVINLVRGFILSPLFFPPERAKKILRPLILKCNVRYN